MKRNDLPTAIVAAAWRSSSAITHDELLAAVAAVLTTALDCQPCPESMIYLALGSDIGKWKIVKAALEQGELATFAGHSIKLTTAGEALARRCNEVLASA